MADKPEHKVTEPQTSAQPSQASAQPSQASAQPSQASLLAPAQPSQASLPAPVQQAPGAITEHARCASIAVADRIFHRFAEPLKVGPTVHDDIPPESIRAGMVKSNKLTGASLFIPLDNAVFQEAHTFLAKNQPDDAKLFCYVHSNPSIAGKTAIFCDRVFPKERPRAKHAYLYNVIPTHIDELQQYATFQEPTHPPWTVCSFKGGGESLDLPEIDDEHINGAIRLLRMVCATSRFGLNTQFGAAYLAVYLHHHQQEFSSALDLAKFAGSYLMLAWPLYQIKPDPYYDDVYQELLAAADSFGTDVDEEGLSRHSLSLFASAENAPSQPILGAAVTGTKGKAASKQALGADKFQVVMNLLLFASEQQLLHWRQVKAPLESCRQLHFSSAAELSAVPVASLSVHLKGVPSAAVDLLLERDIQFSGLISKVLAEIGADLYSVAPEPVMVRMSRSPDSARLKQEPRFSFTIVQCPARGSDESLDRRGGTLAAKLTRFLCAELNAPGEIQVLFQNSHPWYCPPLAPGLLPRLEQEGFEYKQELSGSQLCRPIGSCFFVVSAWYVGVQKYALRTVIDAIELARFSVSRQFNFSEDTG